MTRLLVDYPLTVAEPSVPPRSLPYARAKQKSNGLLTPINAV